MRASIRLILTGGVTAFLLSGLALPAAAQWQTESNDGKASIKLGFLIQPQLELLETVDQEATSTNLFLRRLRSPRRRRARRPLDVLLRDRQPEPRQGQSQPGASAGVKDQSDIYVQDAYVTYSQRQRVQGRRRHDHAAALAQRHAVGGHAAAVDYGPYTFVDSGPGGERVGRDYGVQLRGYPAKQHLEYRLAVSQGVRGDRGDGTRCASPAAPSTTRSARKPASSTRARSRARSVRLGFGGGFDVQEDATDRTRPTRSSRRRSSTGGRASRSSSTGCATTAGTFLPALPKQDAFLVEAGYHVWNHRLTPFVQYQARNFASAATPDQNTLQAGVAWWMAGHQRNLKFSAGRLHTDGLPDRTQVLVQFQLFYF